MQYVKTDVLKMSMFLSSGTNVNIFKPEVYSNAL